MPRGAPDGGRVLFYPDASSLVTATLSNVEAFAYVPIRFQPRVSILSIDHLIQIGADEATGLEFEKFHEFVHGLRLLGIEMVTGSKVPVESPGYATLDAQLHSSFAAGTAHQILGHMNTLQEESQVPGRRLLLQFDSDLAGPGWMWGDGGILWFHILEEALAARQFEACTATWSSC